MYDSGMIGPAPITWNARDHSNALMQNALEKLGLETRAMTSLHIPPWPKQISEKLVHLSKGRIVFLAAATDSLTTDTTAALRSAELAQAIDGEKRRDGVYDSDPRGNNGAKIYDLNPSGSS